MLRVNFSMYWILKSEFSEHLFAFQGTEICVGGIQYALIHGMHFQWALAELFS